MSQVAFLVSTWSGVSVNAFSLLAGAEIAKFEPQIEASFVNRSIIKDEKGIIWIGTSQGIVYASKFENSSFTFL